MLDRTIISGYLDAAIQPWLMPPFIYSPLSLMMALIADWKTSETGKCTMIIIVKFQAAGNLSTFCNPNMKKITKFKDILNRFLDCRLKNFV